MASAFQATATQMPQIAMEPFTNMHDPVANFMREPAVQFEVTMPGPIERIWELLTDTACLPAWFGNGTIEPREGGKVRLLDGHVRGVVTKWAPPRLLVYTWNVYGPDDEESPYPESYVKFELKSHGNEVMLRLTHLPVLDRFEKQNAMGWHTFLDMVQAAARGKDPAPRAEYMKQNAIRYGVDLTNLTS